MKYILFTLMFALLSACGTKSGTNQQNPTTCGGATGFLCMPNPTIMKFKSKDGHEFVGWGDVTSVDIALLATPGGDQPLSRSFSGEDAIKVVRQLSLAFPNEGASPASMTTGMIVLHYKRTKDSVGQTAKLTIQNGRLLADSTFGDVTYDPSQKLDRAWLVKQPL